MAGVTETKLRSILKEELITILKPYEEAREQTWKNEKQILVMQTEKKTVKWGLVAIYSLIGGGIQVIGLLIALEIIKK